MAAKLTRLTHKIATQLQLAPGGQSGNFWIHPRSLLVREEVPPTTFIGPED
jgi:hypothetical protein